MAKKKEIKDAVVSEEKEKKTKAKKAVEEVEKEIDEVEEEIEEEVKEQKEDKPKKEKKVKKEGLFRSVRKEMKQVVWPTGKEILKSTIAVLIMCIFLALFFTGIELLMALIKGWLS